jgi:hypothetical protein
MTLFTDGGARRVCEWCSRSYRPRVEGQRFCGRYCRLEEKKMEGRAARTVWRRAGRPSEAELEKVS